MNLKLTTTLGAVLITALLLPGVAPAVIFNDGLTHDFGGADTLIRIEDGPGATTTTVNVLSTTVISGGIFAYGTSMFTVQPGAQIAGHSELLDATHGNILGGTFGVVDASGTSTLTIAGGTFENSGRTMALFDTAVVDITGGTFPGGELLVEYGGTLNIWDGHFFPTLVDTGLIYPRRYGAVNIYGGVIETPLEANRQDVATPGSVVTLYGTNFAAFDTNGAPLDLSDGEIHEQVEGSLTGILADGTPIDVDFFNRGGLTPLEFQGNEHSKFVFVEAAIVPEPTSFGLVGGALAGIGLLRRRNNMVG